MPIEYAEIILAVVALFAGILYLRVRRVRTKGKKNKNAVRPASPSRTGMASQPTPQQQPSGRKTKAMMPNTIDGVAPGASCLA